MITICKIKTIAQPRTIEVTRMNGQMSPMLVIGLVLTAGGQELYAEMFGDVAEQFDKERCAEGTVLSVDLAFKCREWSKDGVSGYGTNVKISGFTIVQPTPYPIPERSSPTRSLSPGEGGLK